MEKQGQLFQVGDTVVRINSDNCNIMQVGTSWVISRMDKQFLYFENYFDSTRGGLPENYKKATKLEKALL